MPSVLVPMLLTMTFWLLKANLSDIRCCSRHSIRTNDGPASIHSVDSSFLAVSNVFFTSYSLFQSKEQPFLYLQFFSEPPSLFPLLVFVVIGANDAADAAFLASMTQRESLKGENARTSSSASVFGRHSDEKKATPRHARAPVRRHSRADQ